MNRRRSNRAQIQGRGDFQRISAATAIDTGYRLRIVAGIGAECCNITSVNHDSVVTTTAVQHVSTAGTRDGVVAVTGHNLVVACSARQSVCSGRAYDVTVTGLNHHVIDAVHTAKHDTTYTCLRTSTG